MAALATLALGNGAACDLGHDCHDIGCVDSVSVRITTVDQPWPEGEYLLDIALDELGGTCELTLPDDLPTRGSSTRIACLEGAELGIQEVYECFTVREGDGVSQFCEPIADRYEVTLSAYATPARLSLTLSRNGSELLDESRELSYAITRPNGPECEPERRQAAVELTFE